MYMYKYIFIYISMYMYIYICIFICAYVSIHIYVYTYTYIYIYIRIIHKYIHTYICIYVYIHVYIYVYMYIYIYIYIYIHTYIYHIKCMCLYTYICIYITYIPPLSFSPFFPPSCFLTITHTSFFLFCPYNPQRKYRHAWVLTHNIWRLSIQNCLFPGRRLPNKDFHKQISLIFSVILLVNLETYWPSGEAIANREISRFHDSEIQNISAAHLVAHGYLERWGAGVETPKNVRGEVGGWGRVPFNEPYAPSLSTIYDGA